MRRIIWLTLVLGLCFWAFRTSQAVTPALTDTYGFASFWQTNGGELIFGQPITDPLEQDALVVQYFENARFEYDPQTDSVGLGLVGRERTEWRDFGPQPRLAAASLRPEGANYDLTGSFRTFWENNGGVAIFGLPISPAQFEARPTGRFKVQYFERALMIEHPLLAGTADEIELAPLGQEVAAARGLVEGMSYEQPYLFEFDPVAPAPVQTAAPQPVAEPTQVPPTAAPAQPTSQPVPTATPKPANPNVGKRIEVDISKQWLYAYENGTVVFDAPVATGKDGFNTPTGSYEIYAKVPLQTMRGSLGGETWVVPNVPHAMYFNGSVALHGTYWHNLFGSGTRISHGCVNLPLDAAAWLYNWASVGTTVQVYY